MKGSGAQRRRGKWEDLGPAFGRSINSRNNNNNWRLRPGDLETKIDANRTTIEAMGVRVRLKELGAVNLFNVYCPPSRRAGVENANAEDQFRTEDLPKCKNAVYAGDLNAHSDIWDPYMTPDERGEKLENWMMDNNMLCLNDGNATRVNPGTGGLSCPDTTIIPGPWAGRMEWFVGEDLGSDHLPVYVTLEADAKLMDEAPPRTTWSWKKAKWEEYATKVDELIENIPIDASITVRANSLAESMVKAAQQHIGQVTLRSRVVNWMTPEIKEAIKERNELRKNLTNDKQRWVEQCRKIKEMVQEEKTRRWREYLEEAEESQDAANTWRVIKSLSGCPQSNGRNEVLKHEGKTYGSGKKKATIFMQHYAKVSRLKFSREERAVNREMKRKLRIRGKEEQDQEETRDFSVTELETAIHQMKEKSAAGEDAVSPRFIKHLSDKARKFLLKILNDSWRSGFSPQAWRGAVIIPLLKAGKPASKLDSYRPVSLTSCVAKTMERMVANRLQYMAEKHGWWCEEQAGFRSGRCTEDQTIRISQDISDGFQCKPMERSVLALLDYSKAYDKVWREQLLIRMLKKGVPARFVSWIKGFLRNRIARVKVDNQLGKKFSLKEGLPQGAVMSPLLFLFFIDNVKEEIVKERVKVNLSMYADDVAIWSRSVHKLEAQAQVQKAVEIINKWSKKNKLTLNAGKSEAAFFSTDVNEARWEPKIAMDGEFFRFNANPVFLGITFDRTLSFGAQATKAAAKAKRRSNILAACAGQSWGWHKDSLVMTYKSNIRSSLDYGAAGWQPWISATNMELMERAQNNALRRVTRQMKTTPVEALRLEAEISSYKTHSERMIVKSYEKAIRLPEDNPRARATQSVVRHRSKLRSSWREKAKTLREKWEEECRGFLKTTGQKIKCLGRPPWKWETDKHWVAEKSLRGGSTKASTEEAMKADAIETIKSQYMETTIYTDGSASEGWKNGGSAAVVTKGPPEEPEVLAVLKQRGRSWTSSFETEMKALELAVKHLKDSGCKEALICSDSQATISALKSKNKKACTDIRRLREALADIEGLNGNLRINWVPGHCGLAGNELADEAANEAARSGERAQSGDEISMAAATCIIKKAIRDKKTVHPILGETYANKPSTKPESRAQAVMLAQLRSGHHMGLRACNAIVKNGDPTCLRCGEDVETLKHWLQECPASATERRRMFGTDKPPLAVLNSDGAKVCEFIRRTMLTGNEGERSPAQEREMGRSGTGLRPVDQ